jgi:gluconokinase
MVLLVMGVTGSGKTTIGRLLAERLGWTFLDADDFHSADNKQKMGRGVGLTESDRIPWLDVTHAELRRLDASGRNIVLACSALRDDYRRRLLAGVSGTVVYLTGPEAVIRARVRQRPGHFAGESILRDQFTTLEEPANAIAVSVTAPVEQIVTSILARLPRSAQPG